MDGEQESIAAEAEAPITQAIEPDQPTDDNIDPNAEPAETPVEQADPEDDLEEFDWEGKKIKGPKGLKDGLLRQADYTRKTQEVAETRKQLEERAQHIELQAKASDEEMNARAALISVDTALKSYENVDWDRWFNEDFVAAQQGYVKYQELKDSHGKVTGFLSEKQKERTEQANSETKKRLQETRQFAETKIKGWTPEVDAKITDFATKELGFDWNTLKAAYTPAVYKALHLAWLGHQAINTKTAPSTAKPPVTEPLKVVAAKANPPARKSLSEIKDMDEYVAARKAGRGG